MAEKKYYIGLSCTFHDSALAIIDEKGEIIFAEASERYYQSKRAPGIVCDERNFITDVVKKYCDGGKEFVIAYSWSKSFFNKLKLQYVTGIFGIKKFAVDFLLKDVPGDILSSYDLVGLERFQLSIMNQAGVSLNWALKSAFPGCTVKNVYYNHHLTHAAYGCHTSPFEEGTCVVMDGIGEKGSFSVYKYNHNSIQPVFVQQKLASLGFFYALITSLCGFDPYKGEQWKVMGLAPYGKLDNSFYLLLKSMIRMKENDFRFTLIRPWIRSLRELCIKAKCGNLSADDVANMAFTGQQVFSEITEKLLNSFYKLNKSENLIYTGGCALNSSFNGQILRKTDFKRLYIPPAPADDGNALGAALISYYKENPATASLHKNHTPYLGSELSGFAFNNFLKFAGLKKIKYCPGDICERTASLLTEGKLVGWIQGRSEFGPRALGNRSILADPRSAIMKEKINSCIKFREEFRPFAPAVLHEHGHEYFENYDDSPFMERTFIFKKEAVEKVPAVVHVDQSGRTQSVKKEMNQKFYNLISSFYLQTGIPMVLNTSFNIMGKPIIHTLEDALGVFFTSGLDALVIDDYLIEK
jgi:carbamoyltransferase